MRNKNNKHLGIEVDPELHYKYTTFPNTRVVRLTDRFSI